MSNVTKNKPFYQPITLRRKKMAIEAAKIISLTNKENNEASSIEIKSKSNENNQISMQEDDFLSQLAEDISLQEHYIQRERVCLGEIAALRDQNKWQEIIELFYPLEEKEPELVKAGFDIVIRREIAFSLCQVKRFDEAIKELEYCIKSDPNNFNYHSSLGFILYNSLYAAKNKEIIMPHHIKKERIQKAHKHFRRAQEIRPDRVTVYYRQAMLYKHIQNKPEKAIPIFEIAIKNWEKYTKEQKMHRHQEYKNYIKSLYNLSSCYMEKKRFKDALKTIKKCIEEDKHKDYIHCKHKYFALGKIYFHLGKLKQAEEALEFASTFTSVEDGDYIIELLARTLLKQGKKQEALKIITKIPRKKRRHFVIWTLADILVSLGQREDAKKQLLNSCERDRRSKHRALIRLCKIAFQEKNYNESLKWAKEADKFHLEVYNTHDADGLFWVAASYLKLNHKDRAEEIIDELSAFRPDYPFLPKLKQCI